MARESPVSCPRVARFRAARDDRRQPAVMSRWTLPLTGFPAHGSTSSHTSRRRRSLRCTRAPGHPRARRSRRPRSAVPDGVDRPGGVGGAVDRHTGGGAGERLPDVVTARCGGGRPWAASRFPSFLTPASGCSPSSPRRARRSPMAGSSTTSATQRGSPRSCPDVHLGHDFVPPSTHAGGLRYHGASPLISALVRDLLGRRCAGRADQHPHGAVSGSGAAAVVPVAVSTRKPSRIQYSIPPIISLTR
jgi:hypothetical protein